MLATPNMPANCAFFVLRSFLRAPLLHLELEEHEHQKKLRSSPTVRFNLVH